MAKAPAHSAVWFEIPVRDIEAAKTYYSAVTQTPLSIDESGPNPMVMFPVADMSTGVSGHLYPGEPSADGKGPTVHLLVDGPLEETMARVRKAGGQVVSEPIAIPPHGRFAYTIDPDGNSVGVFEAR